MSDPTRPDETPSLPATRPYVPTDEPTVIPDLAVTAGAPLPGTRYRVLGEVGRGGMGVVYRAHDPELDRELALKVLLGADCSDLRRRFIDEARIGGRLQHPGIVPVHELAHDEQGRPFFTMKLVEGRTLALLLAERATPADDRPRFLSVFEQICRTVAYAHAKGVIHRDLKPHNVMIGAFGEVQVMDWGLAKHRENAADVASPSSGASGSSATLSGNVMGTPAYMPPEQARGEADQIDRRADVFSLGAILCEILTGRPPYVASDSRAMLERAEQGNLDDAFARLDACGADPELIGLTKRCLQPDKRNRPADAGEVAEAMTAYLSGVQDRLRRAEQERAAAVVRAAEERKRRRLTVALAAVVLVALGAGVATWRYVETGRQERIASTRRGVQEALDESGTQLAVARTRPDDLSAWTAAESAGRRAADRLAAGEPVSDLSERVDDVLAAATAGKKAAEQRAERRAGEQRLLSTAEQLRLDQGKHLRPDPDLDVTLCRALDAEFAKLHVDLNKPDEAAARLEGFERKAELAAVLDFRASREQDKAASRRILRVARRLDPDPRRDQVRAALVSKDFSAVVQLADTIDAASLPASTLVLLGQTLSVGGEGEAAVSVMRDAAEAHPGDFWVHTMLAIVLENYLPHEKEEALRHHVAALALRPDSPGAWTNVGTSLARSGRADESLAYFKRAQKMDPTHGESANNLAIALGMVGQPEDGVALLRAAVRNLPDNSPPHVNLGDALLMQGKLDEAIEEYREALRLYEDHAGARLNLGIALSRKGELKEGLKELDEVVRVRPDWPKAHYNRGVTLSVMGDPRRARVAMEKALQIDPDYADALNNLGSLLTAEGKHAAAARTYRRLLKVDPDSAAGWNGLGNVLSALDQKKEAVEAYRKAAGLAPDDHRPWFNVGSTLAEMEDYRGAADAFRASLGVKPDFALTHRRLGVALMEFEDLDGAEKAMLEACRLDSTDPNNVSRASDLLRKRYRFAESVEAARLAVCLAPDDPQFVLKLGAALLRRGDYDEALAWLLRGREGGDDDLLRASAGTLRETRQAVKESRELNDYLAGRRRTSPAELCDLANTAGGKGWYATAAELYARAFAAEPALRTSPEQIHRLRAVMAAFYALADTGREPQPPDEKRREQVRLNGIAWLSEELDSLENRWRDGPKLPMRNEVLARLGDWRNDRHFAALRAADAPEDYRRLWRRIEALTAEARQADERITTMKRYGKQVHPMPECAGIHLTVGRAREDNGQYHAAYENYSAGLKIDAEKHHAELKKRMAAIDRRVADLEAGRARPAGPNDAVAWALFCLQRQPKPALAVRLFRDAFAMRPSLVADLDASYRYNAACAAALAGVGQGDALLLSESQRLARRRQALTWLTADLAARRRAGRTEDVADWLRDTDLAGVREPAALARLSAEERQAWQALWKRVERAAR